MHSIAGACSFKWPHLTCSCSALGGFSTFVLVLGTWTSATVYTYMPWGKRCSAETDITSWFEPGAESWSLLWMSTQKRNTCWCANMTYVRISLLLSSLSELSEASTCFSNGEAETQRCWKSAFRQAVLLRCAPFQTPWIFFITLLS